MYACFGCQRAPNAPPANTAEETLSVALTMSPENPRQMDPVAFTVTVADKHGKPIQDARVSAALVMPSMDMGRNEVAFKHSRAGAYTGSGRFTMSGEWNVVVTASVGRKNAMRSFSVPVH